MYGSPAAAAPHTAPNGAPIHYQHGPPRQGYRVSPARMRDEEKMMKERHRIEERRLKDEHKASGGGFMSRFSKRGSSPARQTPPPRARAGSLPQQAQAYARPVQYQQPMQHAPAAMVHHGAHVDQYSHHAPSIPGHCVPSVPAHHVDMYSHGGHVDVAHHGVQHVDQHISYPAAACPPAYVGAHHSGFEMNTCAPTMAMNNCAPTMAMGHCGPTSSVVGHSYGGGQMASYDHGYTGGHCNTGAVTTSHFDGGMMNMGAMGGYSTQAVNYSQGGHCDTGAMMFNQGHQVNYSQGGHCDTGAMMFSQGGHCDTGVVQSNCGPSGFSFGGDGGNYQMMGGANQFAPGVPSCM